MGVYFRLTLLREVKTCEATQIHPTRHFDALHCQKPREHEGPHYDGEVEWEVETDEGN